MKYRSHPSRREVRAALDWYKTQFREDFSMSEIGKPGTCWAMVEGTGVHNQTGNEYPCPVTAGTQEYKVTGRMDTTNRSGVTPGLIARMWLCAKHANLMKRRGYTMTLVTSSDPDTDVTKVVAPPTVAGPGSGA